ncbi:MAG: hypothetical protein NTU44_01455, partial [Bacteroidetes bacterium]|nr:hypothetical protein [Bacteroidota bacterium]
MELKDFPHYLFGKTYHFEGEIDQETAAEVFDPARLNQLSHAFMDIPVLNVLSMLEETSRLLCDHSGRYYRQAIEIFPQSLQYSPEMVDFGFDVFRQANTRDMLTRMLWQVGK